MEKYVFGVCGIGDPYFILSYWYKNFGWLVGCFGFNGPLRRYFSLYRAVSHFWLFLVYGPLRQYFSLHRAVSQKRGRKRKEMIDESKNVQTTPTRTNCKCTRPLPYCNQDCRTPRHWKFTQHQRTTRPPLGRLPKRRRKKRESIVESKNVQNPPPASIASAAGPCPTLIRIVGRPGTGRLPSTIAPPDHPRIKMYKTANPRMTTCNLFILKIAVLHVCLK